MFAVLTQMVGDNVLTGQASPIVRMIRYASQHGRSPTAAEPSQKERPRVTNEAKLGTMTCVAFAGLAFRSRQAEGQIRLQDTAKTAGYPSQVLQGGGPRWR